MSDRLLISLDLESDGPGDPDPATDRIVSFGLRIGEETKHVIVNPLLQLQRTEIHGIAQEQVNSAHPFQFYARTLHRKLIGANLLTYDGHRYDVPLLWHEFKRAGVNWDYRAHRHVDLLALWRKMEPRTLYDAYWKFVNRERGSAAEFREGTNLHDAGEDATTTAFLLPAMTRHFGLDLDIEKLAELTKPTIKIDGVECEPVDLAGTLARRPDGVVVFTHRKVRGKPISSDLGYAAWMLKNDFSPETKMKLEEALEEAAQREAKEEETSDDML